MNKQINFGLYEQLHSALQNAKMFSNEFIDGEMFKLKQEYDKLRDKYFDKPPLEWDIQDLKRSIVIHGQLTSYYKGLNMVEIILQKIGKPNGD